MFAELLDRSLEAQFDHNFDERGTFIKKRLKRRYDWYYQRWIDGKPTLKYVGPSKDNAITQRVDAFRRRIKPEWQQRRELVRELVAAGLPQPDSTTGRVVEALWTAGLFRLRCVLVGTTAFQCYAGPLLAKLKSTSLRTTDADFAQYLAISREIEDAISPIAEVLDAVDRSFRPIMSAVDGRHVVAFANDDGYKVELLTAFRGFVHRSSAPLRILALSGVSAIPLPYMDDLLREPVRSVVLYSAGIPDLGPVSGEVRSAQAHPCDAARQFRRRQARQGHRAGLPTLCGDRRRKSSNRAYGSVDRGSGKRAEMADRAEKCIAGIAGQG